MKRKQDYPYVSIENTQVKGVYEVSIRVAPNISQSYFIDENNLDWIETDIKMIRETKK